jgi:hypothetical protein
LSLVGKLPARQSELRRAHPGPPELTPAALRRGRAAPGHGVGPRAMGPAPSGGPEPAPSAASAPPVRPHPLRRPHRTRRPDRIPARPLRYGRATEGADPAGARAALIGGPAVSALRSPPRDRIRGGDGNDQGGAGRGPCPAA